MSSLLLDELLESFDDRNLLLQVALGLLSCAGRFDALIAAQIATVGRAASDAPPPSDIATEGTLDAVLGLVSFFRNVEHHVATALRDGGEAAPTPERAPGDREAHAVTRLRDILA